MIPDKLAFLNKFDRFYQALVNNVKEAKKITSPLAFS